jgi:deazaflavin-dependent oxidoreductase (nitroreductase family)
MKQTSSQKRSASSRSFSFQRLATNFHVWLYQTTGGRIGHYLGNVPVLLLTTTGRKTGKQHITPLTYATDGENIILIASNGGSLNHPSWWLNLQAHPETMIQVGNKKLQLKASEAPDEDRSRLWKKAEQIYPGYARYQQKTPRKIPVVVLSPIQK